MAVYRRGYQRYQGPVTGAMTRLLVMPRYAWERILSQRIVVVLLVVALFWPIVCGAFIYVSNHMDLLQGVGGAASAKLLEINANFFLTFMKVQWGFAMILAAIAGPGLVAPDLANNALPLYFSRPMTLTTYVLARMLVLVGILSLVTLLPGAALFGMQVGMASGDWLGQNWQLGTGMLVGFSLWILQISLVALACSAYVKWRVVAGALVMAFFFLLAGAAEMVNAIFRTDWASA